VSNNFRKLSNMTIFPGAVSITSFRACDCFTRRARGLDRSNSVRARGDAQLVSILVGRGTWSGAGKPSPREAPRAKVGHLVQETRP
jgi:hypothetical protein